MSIIMASYWFWVPYISLHLPCSTAEWPMSGQVTAEKSEGEFGFVWTSKLPGYILVLAVFKTHEDVGYGYGREKYSRTHLGGASMGLHLAESWHITELVTGPASRNPGLHWYVALAPREKSWPTMLPLTGGTGIPQDMTRKKVRKTKEEEKKRKKLSQVYFYKHLCMQSANNRVSVRQSPRGRNSVQ